MRMKMKRWFLIVISAVLMLSSCTPLTSEIEKLLTAPNLRADQKEIVLALKKVVGDTVILKYPSKGSNISPFLSADIDLDGEEEVVAFYQKSASGKANVAVMDKVNGKWNCSYSVEGEGMGVLKTDFIEFTGESEKELVVGYTNDEGKNKLAVYSLNNGKVITSLDFTDYDIISYGAGINDQLVVVELKESAATKVLQQNVSCYRYEEGTVQQRVSYAADSVMKGYQQIECVVRPDFSALIYLDSFSGGKVSTEVFKLENDKLYPILTDGFTRTIRLYCRDINDDAIPEIPKEIPYTLSDEELTEKDAVGLVLPIRWSTISGESLEELHDSVINTSFGYYIDLPNEYRGKTFFKQNDTGNLLSAYVYTGSLADTSKELFSIKAVYRYDEPPTGYTLIGESQSVYFYAKINSSVSGAYSSLETTYDALEDSLKLL